MSRGGGREGENYEANETRTRRGISTGPRYLCLDLNSVAPRPRSEKNQKDVPAREEVLVAYRQDGAVGRRYRQDAARSRIRRHSDDHRLLLGGSCSAGSSVVRDGVDHRHVVRLVGVLAGALHVAHREDRHGC